MTNDLTLYRCRNGIKLVDPVKTCNGNLPVEKNISPIFFDIRCNMALMVDQEVIYQANDKSASFSNVELSEYIGKSITHFHDKATTQPAIKNNIAVMEEDNLKIFNELIYQPDGLIQECLSIKLPLYNDDEQTIGIACFGIMHHRDNFAECLTEILKLGILNQSSFAMLSAQPLKIGEVHLATRESQCVRLAVRGKTAHESARMLNLSKRTVECYLENAKFKLNVNSKQELIDKVFDHVTHQ